MQACLRMLQATQPNKPSLAQPVFCVVGFGSGAVRNPLLRLLIYVDPDIKIAPVRIGWMARSLMRRVGQVGAPQLNGLLWGPKDAT